MLIEIIKKHLKLYAFLALVSFSVIYFLLAKSENKTVKIKNSRHFVENYNGPNEINALKNKRCKTGWSDAPNLTLMCRAYKGSILEYYNIFLVGYHLFWPKDRWPNSDLVLVLDDESEIDHRLATVLVNLPPYPKVFFEKLPNEETFCSGDRRLGYSRQQYSNFYSDLYTDKEFIGIVDSDSFFSTYVIPENLFVDGKPRIYGVKYLSYNGCCTGWDASLKEAINADYNIGEFMVVIGFPVMIKRSHFKPMREHITRQMKAQTFEEAFHKICSKYLYKYSQFDLIAHYLWFYHRDEYSWHLVDWNQSKHPAFSQRMSDHADVLKMNRPIQGIMKHGNHHVFSDYVFKLSGDYLCVASQNEAGSCKRFFTKSLYDGTFKNLFVDWQFRTSNWEEREMESKPDFSENPWSKPDFTYKDTYNLYKRQLYNRLNSSSC